jgi:hypothetical protein
MRSQQVQQNQMRSQQVQQNQMQQLMQQFNSKTRVIPPNINKFSSAYSRIMAAKTKASKSVNIKMGGVY